MHFYDVSITSGLRSRFLIQSMYQPQRNNHPGIVVIDTKPEVFMIFVLQHTAKGPLAAQILYYQIAESPSMSLAPMYPVHELQSNWNHRSIFEAKVKKDLLPQKYC